MKLTFLEHFLYILVLTATILWFIYVENKQTDMLTSSIVATVIAVGAAGWHIYNLMQKDGEGLNIMENLQVHMLWLCIITTAVLWYSFYKSTNPTTVCNLKSAGVGFSVATVLFLYILIKLPSETE
jgi:hypothetical protein